MNINALKLVALIALAYSVLTNRSPLSPDVLGTSLAHMEKYVVEVR
jgi:hypothetical protein